MACALRQMQKDQCTVIVLDMLPSLWSGAALHWCTYVLVHLPLSSLSLSLCLFMCLLPHELVCVCVSPRTCISAWFACSPIDLLTCFVHARSSASSCVIDQFIVACSVHWLWFSLMSMRLYMCSFAILTYWLVLCVWSPGGAVNRLPLDFIITSKNVF